MMKKILVTSLLAVATLTASAQPISREQAKDRAFAYLRQTPAATGPRHAMSRKAQWKEARLEGAQHIYAFNLDGGGFVIASGDERALPVLGYSNSGAIDYDNMPANMRWWLKGYEEAIAALGNTVVISPVAQGEQRAAIAPMLKTTWDQEPVYNQDCPVYNGTVEKYKGKATLTGCVATAAAMVMNYHHYPDATTSPIPAYDYELSGLADDVTENIHVDALPVVTFDWNNMREAYYYYNANNGNTILPDVTEQQKKAVSTLMRYCGQASHMKYSPVNSSTYSDYMAQALRHYFNYDKGLRNIYRMNYGIDEWETICYNELAAQRPVIYGGVDNEGGHAFVCDGYDGNGLFHINWGWGGYFDNYFALSVLNPYSYNTGTAAIGTGLCIKQEMIIGMQPPTEGTVATDDRPKLAPHSGFMVSSYDDNNYLVSAEISYSNMIYPEVFFEYDLFYKDQNGTMTRATNTSEEPYKVMTGMYYIFKTLSPKRIEAPDGELMLYLMERCTSVEGCDWQLVSPKLALKYTVKDGVVSLQPVPTPQLSITDCKVTRGNSTVMKANDITVTLQNKGNEYQGLLTLLPYYIGQDDMQTAYDNIINGTPEASNYTVEPEVMSFGYLRVGESANVTFSFTPQKAGQYLFLLTEKGNRTVLGYFSIRFGEETNAVRAVAIEKATDAPTFDLQGRRVGHQPHGIVIQNGKKYLRR